MHFSLLTTATPRRILFSKIDQMKHLLTAIACCLAVAGSSQTPYNPDSNGDNVIAMDDFLDFLPLYGGEFYPSPALDYDVVWITDNHTSDVAMHYMVDYAANSTNGNDIHISFDFTDDSISNFLNGTRLWFFVPSEYGVEAGLSVTFMEMCEDYEVESSRSFWLNGFFQNTIQNSRYYDGCDSTSSELYHGTLDKYFFLNGKFYQEH
jgi:hypothetical protein